MSTIMRWNPASSSKISAFDAARKKWPEGFRASMNGSTHNGWRDRSTALETLIYS